MTAMTAAPAILSHEVRNAPLAALILGVALLSLTGLQYLLLQPPVIRSRWIPTVAPVAIVSAALALLLIVLRFLLLANVWH
jgi:hypothetical protein